MAGFEAIFLFTIALISHISAQCNYGTAMLFFEKSIYEFTLKLVEKINQETEGHYIASALSPWTLLSALSFGASNTTLKEIQEVLQLHPDQCINNIYFELVKQATMKPSNRIAYRLERSSTIFLDESLQIKQSFFDSVSKVGICDARIVSFLDTIETAAVINEHVLNATNEAIEIVTPNDLDGILTVMVDALYFIGAWKVPFPYADTEISAFYNDKGQQIGDASLMYVCGSFNVTIVPQIKATVLELPYYGDDSRYSMLIFLPSRNVSLTHMVHLMKNISISSIFVLYQEDGPKTVTVQIPRFKISSDINNMKKHLIDIGLKTIFDQEANFPGISDHKLFLSNFIQKAEIKVTEDGTVAAVATIALFESRLMPDQFVADKPFMFMIVDRILHVPILTGAYSKPSIF